MYREVGQMEGIGVQGPKKFLPIPQMQALPALQANFEYAYTLGVGSAGNVGKSQICKILPTP